MYPRLTSTKNSAQSYCLYCPAMFYSDILVVKLSVVRCSFLRFSKKASLDERAWLEGSTAPEGAVNERGQRGISHFGAHTIQIWYLKGSEGVLLSLIGVDCPVVQLSQGWENGTTGDSRVFLGNFRTKALTIQICFTVEGFGFVAE